MMNRDYLIKAMDNDKQVRVFIAHTTAAVEEAHSRHYTSATASAALGRVLTAALLMGSDLKGDNDVLTIRINGNGPAGAIIASADSQGNVRGLISNPEADLPSHLPGKLNVGDLVGQDGYLEVLKDIGLKQPFTGRVSLISGEIAEDLASYFLKSEQIPSLVALGVLVSPDLSIRAAGGLFVQALPGAENQVLEQIEANILRLGPISDLMKNHAALEEILQKIFEGIPYSVVGEQPLAFKCTCNSQKLAMVLAGFPMDEIYDIYRSEGKLELICNFCNEIYNYQPEEIEAITKQKDTPFLSRQIHETGGRF
ncbi:MAG: Hsp33 family molecular chaperone HslO [Syntrophomonadaceae bacterium]|nr:Hsp33 family molecular chaperone HslO [Syntrophomonadaceae bacterium]MDD3024076.1 Hsp33 family molecular chaperone HslO [Syntrophomonadaceae bacterium]